MTNEERKVFELAIEWIEKQPEETPESKYDVNSRYVVIREIEAALAQPEQEISVTVLQAITNAGLTLLKTQHGYELRKLGPAIAHGIKE